MNTALNSIINNGLEALSSAAPRHVVSAIESAASENGVDFAYLLQQAKAESSFNPDAKAKTSSASGLFQFIESTWMNMVERYGDKYGIDANTPKEDLLDLRFDPELAANMAAEFANENQRILQRNWGGDIGSTELYFAHFMGASGASAFLNVRDEDPTQQAALLFPKAAAANENVFYDRATGEARTLDEVYAFFDKKFQIEGSQSDSVTQLAEATIPETAPVSNLAYKPAPVIKQRPSAAVIPSSYQSMLANPLDLIMLTQLDLPFFEGRSIYKSNSVF